MTKRCWLLSVVTTACLGAALLCLPAPSTAQDRPDQPIRGTLTFEGVEREYFVRLPSDFDPAKQYWLLVVVHGGGGNGRTFFMANEIRLAADDLGLDAIVVSPSFPTNENITSRFPVLGEGEFLNRVVDELRQRYRLRMKFLLTGYSRGGQFTHRFALANPAKVETAAPLASGTWTTPDGTLLLEDFGPVANPESFLASAESAAKIPERLRDLFDPRVAKVAGLKAAPGAEKIPFLVMCGILDPRLSIAKEFVDSLEALGYRVETAWPRTAHGCRGDAECASEFKKYSQYVVEFFLRVTQGK